MQNFNRITFDPNIMGGKACIRGMRVTVGTVVGLVATGYSNADILKPILIWKKKISVNPFLMPHGEFKKLKCR